MRWQRGSSIRQRRSRVAWEVRQRIPAISTVSGIHNAPVTTVRYVSAVHYCIALYSDELVLNQCRTMEWPRWMATGRYMGVSRFCVFIYKNVLLLLLPKGSADLRPVRSVMWHLPAFRSIKTTKPKCIKDMLCS